MGFRMFNTCLDVLQLASVLFPFRLTSIDSNQVRSTIIFLCDGKQVTGKYIYILTSV